MYDPIQLRLWLALELALELELDLELMLELGNSPLLNEHVTLTLPFLCSVFPPSAGRVDFSWTLCGVTGPEQNWRLGQTSPDPQPGAQSMTQ